MLHIFLFFFYFFLHTEKYPTVCLPFVTERFVCAGHDSGNFTSILHKKREHVYIYRMRVYGTHVQSLAVKGQLELQVRRKNQ